MNNVALYALLIAQIFFIAFLLMTIIHNVMSLWGGLRFAPYVPSTTERVEIMIRLAQVQPGMRTIELGSGDGRITIAAARHGARATGYEADPLLVAWSRLKARLKKVRGADFQRASIWAITWPPETDVVFVYGLPRFMGKVWEKACKELRPGTKIVSNAFQVPNQKPMTIEGAVEVYIVPKKMAE